MDAEGSTHTLITAKRVMGAPVLSPAGEKLGHVHDLSIHKVSGQVVYALISFGGFLGVGEQIHPVPWSVLDYEPTKGGYVTSLTKADLEAAPMLSEKDFEDLGAGDAWRARIFDYYGRYGAVPYI
jgi:hypothetical protein